MKPVLKQAWKGRDDRWLTIIGDEQGGSMANKEYGRAIAVVYGPSKAECECRAQVVFAALEAMQQKEEVKNA
jgi:hypothetical protein